MNTLALYKSIVTKLEAAGHHSPYVSDANEPDSRYLGYGVRTPEMKTLISGFRNELASLSQANKLKLAMRLLESGYGEQKTVALHLLDQITNYFEPDKFETLDQIFRNLHGWSKVDAYTGSLLKNVLFAYPDECLKLVDQWNKDEDLWLRRTSVVLFTRKVAACGQFTATALENCENLKHDQEDLVQKGVGWCLKDLMQYDKERILPYVVELRRQKISSTITLYALRNVKGREREKILKTS